MVENLYISVDLAGCPNRCRHCWLGEKRNGRFTREEFRQIAEAFRNWRGADGEGISRVGFLSWWREPDYRDDYRELWELEKELSFPGMAMRFELLSTWRLARDPSYAAWASEVGPHVCQISFHGMEENTDWFMRRKGGFRDQIAATEACLKAGISPRWQLFLTKKSLQETDALLRLMDEMQLVRRCGEIGGRFAFFLNSFAPEGGAYALDPYRLEKDDLSAIPRAAIDMSRDGLSMLGRPEGDLVAEMEGRADAVHLDASLRAIAVDADYDVYPNIAEPAPWWRLANLKADGVDAVMRAYLEGSTPGMRAARTVPIGALSARYGKPGGTRLYDGSDLVTRFLHQWGTDHRNE